MFRIIKISLLTIAVAGCASAPERPREILDPHTSASITYSQTTMLFFRDDPAHAAHAKNLVSVGPLQVNRSGHYRYYLWLGIWNTNHTVSTADGRDGFDSIVLYVDGQPIQLEVAGWTPSAIGASQPVYPPPVASALDAYYEVTVDQIRFITEARDVSLQTTGFRSQSFEPWDDLGIAQQGFRSFLTLAY